MTLALCFWILMLLWFCLNGYIVWRGNVDYPLGTLLPWLLFLLLGWATFGAPIKS
jgi:hypothetical protein